MSKEDYSGFAGIQYSEEKYKLKSNIIKSEAISNSYTNYEIMQATPENNWVEEWRPIYPKWDIVNMTTGNFSDKEPEEQSVRSAMEAALSIQNDAQKTFQIKKVKCKELVRLHSEEPITQALAFAGYLPEKKILLQTFDENGNEVMEEKIMKDVPFFTLVKGENLPLFEEKEVEKKIKTYLNLAPECWRLFNYCIKRIDLTKSRNMEAVKQLETTHSKSTLYDPNKFEKEEAEKSNNKGLFG